VWLGEDRLHREALPRLEHWHPFDPLRLEFFACALLLLRSVDWHDERKLVPAMDHDVGVDLHG
jgi:hypothetical protein